jgi:hypothetical protein
MTSSSTNPEIEDSIPSRRAKKMVKSLRLNHFTLNHPDLLTPTER